MTVPGHLHVVFDAQCLQPRSSDHQSSTAGVTRHLNREELRDMRDAFATRRRRERDDCATAQIIAGAFQVREQQLQVVTAMTIRPRNLHRQSWLNNLFFDLHLWYEGPRL